MINAWEYVLGKGQGFGPLIFYPVDPDHFDTIHLKNLIGFENGNKKFINNACDDKNSETLS